MAAAVKTAPRTGYSAGAVKHKPSGDVAKVASQLSRTTSELGKMAATAMGCSQPKSAAAGRESKYLPKEQADQLKKWVKGRLDRIAKTHNPNLVLFCIGKNENDNTVVYKGMLKPGTATLADPAARVFWIKYKKAADGSKEEPLLFLEKQIAYGMEVKPGQGGEAVMTIVPLPTNPMRIRIERLAGETKPRIVARARVCGVDNCRILGVYVTVKDGFVPGVKYVDIVAEHPKTGATLAERVQG
eukprot:Hpha_TRINITY_DN14779_c0_g2::TRINITY_DN14779_c0_g2_i1::g.103166::m.103166